MCSPVRHNNVLITAIGSDQGQKPVIITKLNVDLGQDTFGGQTFDKKSGLAIYKYPNIGVAGMILFQVGNAN